MQLSYVAQLRRDQSPGYLVNHVARLFAYGLYRRLLPHGVAPGQFPVLLSLWEQDGLTQAELARRLAIEQPTMANTLRRMERDGLIRRSSDPGDGRRSLIHLTNKGRSLEPTLTSLAREVNGVALSPLLREERASLISMLIRMRTALTVDLEGESE